MSRAALSLAQWRLGLAALLVVTLIWGSTFAIIKETVAGLHPGSLILGRFGLAALLLAPLFGRHAIGWPIWRAGLLLGFLNLLGYTSQAIGLRHTSASRSGFITALSVVLVPLLAGLAGRRIRWTVYLAAMLALLGVGLLGGDGPAPNRGDAWTLVTAFSYALYVLQLERAVRRHDTRGLTLTQLGGVLPFALPWALLEAGVDASRAGDATGVRVTSFTSGLLEHWQQAPFASWLGLIYLALAATALTTLLQTYGQRRVAAPEAAIIYTGEPLWAALFAAAMLGERMGARGWAGAGLILVATLVGTLPGRRRSKALVGLAPPDQGAAGSSEVTPSKSA